MVLPFAQFFLCLLGGGKYSWFSNRRSHLGAFRLLGWDEWRRLHSPRLFRKFNRSYRLFRPVLCPCKLLPSLNSTRACVNLFWWLSSTRFLSEKFSPKSLTLLRVVHYSRIELWPLVNVRSSNRATSWMENLFSNLKLKKIRERLFLKNLGCPQALVFLHKSAAYPQVFQTMFSFFRQRCTNSFVKEESVDPVLMR